MGHGRDLLRPPLADMFPLWWCRAARWGGGPRGGLGASSFFSPHFLIFLFLPSCPSSYSPLFLLTFLAAFHPVLFFLFLIHSSSCLLSLPCPPFPPFFLLSLSPPPVFLFISVFPLLPFSILFPFSSCNLSLLSHHSFTPFLLFPAPATLALAPLSAQYCWPEAPLPASRRAGRATSGALGVPASPGMKPVKPRAASGRSGLLRSHRGGSVHLFAARGRPISCWRLFLGREHISPALVSASRPLPANALSVCQTTPLFTWRTRPTPKSPSRTSTARR